MRILVLFSLNEVNELNLILREGIQYSIKYLLRVFPFMIVV